MSFPFVLAYLCYFGLHLAQGRDDGISLISQFHHRPIDIAETVFQFLVFRIGRVYMGCHGFF